MAFRTAAKRSHSGFTPVRTPRLHRSSGFRSGGGVPVSDWLRGGDYGGATYSNPFTQVSFVYRAITALAEQVANIPFRFAAIAEGKDRITTGRLHEFYTRPHPSLNGFQYWELRVMWLLVRGECFRVPVFAERNGRII